MRWRALIAALVATLLWAPAARSATVSVSEETEEEGTAVSFSLSAAGGEVGPIGGIRQKLYGAEAAGATVFLAPAANCDEVVGHIPDGLDVYAVKTLDQAVSDLVTIASGKSTAGLATCGR